MNATGKSERATQGRGFQCILGACREAGSQEPVVQYQPGDFWLEFPFAEDYVRAVSGGGTPQVTPEVMRLLATVHGAMTRTELMGALDLKDEKHFREHCQQSAVTQGLIEMTRPDAPRSRLQRYRLTDKGRIVLAVAQKREPSS